MSKPPAQPALRIASHWPRAHSATGEEWQSSKVFSARQQTIAAARVVAWPPSKTASAKTCRTAFVMSKPRASPLRDTRMVLEFSFFLLIVLPPFLLGFLQLPNPARERAQLPGHYAKEFVPSDRQACRPCSIWSASPCRVQGDSIRGGQGTESSRAQRHKNVLNSDGLYRHHPAHARSSLRGLVGHGTSSNGFPKPRTSK